MKSLILGMLAETAIHPGAGQSAGFVDLPVAREAATDYPVIVGSSLKGALRDNGRRLVDKTRIDQVFGQQENAGNLLVSDARLVLLPVRSLTGHYRWLTCPHLLTRLARDLARGQQAPPATADTAYGSLVSDQYRALGQGTPDSYIFLEERQFQLAGSVPQPIIDTLATLFADAATAKTLAERLVVVHDDDFSWFARYGLSVAARNVLDDQTKTSKNLWYEETIPADSLFYSLLAERRDGALTAVKEIFARRPYLQVGGNETVGQGWFAIELLEGGAQ
ncbi:MAG: type III-B CRISPR module RAMP protein Cmr4 [Bradymonadaceae bacterium]